MMSSRAKTRDLTAQMTQKIKRALAPLKGEPRIQVALRAFFMPRAARASLRAIIKWVGQIRVGFLFYAARSASERSERLKQESSPKATPLKAVSRKPSAVSRRQRSKPSARLTSDRLTVFRLAHKCRTTALRAFALCTLHSALLKQESCPKGTPLKAVSHQPSAVTRQPSAGDLAECAFPVFQSDSLSSSALGFCFLIFSWPFPCGGRRRGPRRGASGFCG